MILFIRLDMVNIIKMFLAVRAIIIAGKKINYSMYKAEMFHNTLDCLILRRLWVCYQYLGGGRGVFKIRNLIIPVQGNKVV